MPEYDFPCDGDDGDEHDDDDDDENGYDGHDAEKALGSCAERDGGVMLVLQLMLVLVMSDDCDNAGCR